MHKISLSINW